MFEWFILGLIFLATLGLTLTIYQWILERRQRAELELATADEPVAADASLMILGPLTPVAAAHSPVAAEKLPELQQELREAGFYHRNAVIEFQAVRAISILLPLFGACFLALLAQKDDVPRIVVIGVVLGALGFSLPRVYINYVARRRAREIERGLPVALDLLNLGLSGGQNLFSALESVSREIQRAFPVLASELRIVREQAKLSSLTVALTQFAERVSLADVSNLAMVLAQTDKLGTDVSAALLDFAHNIRMNMRHRAEAHANRANFWMLFPTIICLWIPAALVLVGPVYFEMIKKRPDTRAIFESTSETLKKTNPMAPTDMTSTKKSE